MKKDSIKTLLYWLIILVIIATYVCYITFDWTTALANINKYLDAAVKTVGLLVISSALMKVLAFIAKKSAAKTKKGQTVAKLLESIIKYVIAIIAIIVCLGFFIEDTSSLITGVSMLTLVVGLGAQSLISDVVAGIFIVFEGDYQVGDVVVIDGWRGKVNEIGLRTTKIEDAGGNIQIINNSKISKIINNSSQLSLAICDVGIEYGESIERVENILKDALPHMKEKFPAIVEGPFYKGVEALADSAVIIKILAKCSEDDKFQLQRDLNREIKIIFDKNNVGIPFPQITISKFQENTNEATHSEKKQAEKFVTEQGNLSKGIEETNS